MKVEKRKLLLPFNIQMFADGDGGTNDGGNPPAPKTYSEEEYKKLQDELSKMKNSFDKASSDLAEEKKKNKAKMSEDEKRKVEDEEKQKRFDEMETKLKKYELKASLSKCFEETETDEIIEAIVSNDTTKLAELISKSHEAYKKKIQDEAKKEFSKSAKIPGGNNSGEDGDENSKMIEELAKAQSGGNKSVSNNKAWDNYKTRH